MFHHGSAARKAGVTVLIAVGALIVLGGDTRAYNKYADDAAPDPDATNCSACHGPFNSGVNYTEMEPGGGAWSNDLMTTHSDTFLNGDCDTCHSTGGRTPVFLNSSRGGDGLAAISCVGCHGRLEDATAGTDGAGAGLRRHHINAGASDCWEPCHNHLDSDPGATPPVLVGENVLPEYYKNPGVGHNIPTSACDSSENLGGSSNEQDNDGDLLYEGADPDCPCIAGATPGEVSGSGLPQLLVTAHDSVAGRITVSYAPACCAQDNNFYFGFLNDLPAFNYAGRACGILNTGTYEWTYPADQELYYFVVVGQDGVVEGSYGTKSDGGERDEDVVCEPLMIVDECS